jgi:hypothetical protein
MYGLIQAIRYVLWMLLISIGLIAIAGVIYFVITRNDP